jgi:hypothetical protein
MQLSDEKQLRAQKRAEQVKFRMIKQSEDSSNLHYCEYTDAKEALEAVAKLSIESYSLMKGVDVGNRVDKSVFSMSKR